MARLSVLALAVIWLLGGCGASTVTVTATTHTAAAGTTATLSTDASTIAAPSEPPTRFVRDASFQSPSGNIGCMIISGTARCDIVHRTWVPPPRPASCPQIVDFGQDCSLRARATRTSSVPATP